MFDNDLSVIHAATLSAMTERRVPLAMWGIGVIILPENIMGVAYINKLQAIGLFEADFNWQNKLIFTRRAIRLALRLDTSCLLCSRIRRSLRNIH